MKLFKITALLLIMLSLEACGILTTYKPAPDVDKAIFYTPKGEFEITSYKTYDNTFYASDENHTVEIHSLFPVSRTTTLEIGVAEKTSVEMNPDNAYYQLNGGEKIKLGIRQGVTHPNIFIITAPATMDAYIYSGGTGLRLSMEGRSSGIIDDKAEDKMEDETYRYYIPFKLDGQDYAVDITFRLDYQSDRRIGVPGVP